MNRPRIIGGESSGDFLGTLCLNKCKNRPYPPTAVSSQTRTVGTRGFNGEESFHCLLLKLAFFHNPQDLRTTTKDTFTLLRKVEAIWA